METQFAWHPLASGSPPVWASAWGEDSFGPWVKFRVGEAVQCLRWVAPGSFLMGSPKEEKGRRDNEGPQREVVISRGFWLFDTPCRQDLWEAVMGENPSHFKGRDRPVESVSWEQCQDFVQALNKQIADFHCRLPYEAEWEFAARSGTTGPYAGDLEEMAWYGDNSGKSRIDAAGIWAKGNLEEFEANKCQTHPVGEKKPNSWGLYDMHGNVWEWVQDRYAGDYYRGRLEPDVDPRGPESGALRVFRGGGWSDPARLVRAACRDWSEPGDRSLFLGFRCALVQEPEAGK